MIENKQGKNKNVLISKSRGMIYVILSLLFFLSIYYVIDFYSRNRSEYYKIDFNWESGTPYIPSMFIIYYSIIILPFMIPIYIRNKIEFSLLFKRIFIALGIASVSYLLFPAKLAYPLVSNNSWKLIEKATPILAGHHNLMPSLHVTISILIINALWIYLSNLKKVLIILFLILLIISVLFTHQHHFIDIITGLFLAILVILSCRK